MAKDTYYFSHDYNARNDEKILELRSTHGAEGYGLFWMIVETMAENENGGISLQRMGGLSLGYGVAIGRLSEVISACLTIGLFYENDGNIFSKRLLSHKELRKSLSESGSEGAKRRWGGYRGAIGEGNGEGYAKERKGKERKKERAVAFSDDGSEAIFKNGERQKLGLGQQRAYKEGGYQPHFIKKGEIE